uniref:Glutenin, low molecular weight subunit n=1 Tax=Steinernema glaseri TaxID=37863 RepID=A0A1I8AH00_9BILA
MNMNQMGMNQNQQGQQPMHQQMYQSQHQMGMGRMMGQQGGQQMPQHAGMMNQGQGQPHQQFQQFQQQQQSGGHQQAPGSFMSSGASQGQHQMQVGRTSVAHEHPFPAIRSPRTTAAAEHSLDLRDVQFRKSASQREQPDDVRFSRLAPPTYVDRKWKPVHSSTAAATERANSLHQCRHSFAVNRCHGESRCGAASAL